MPFDSLLNPADTQQIPVSGMRLPPIRPLLDMSNWENNNSPPPSFRALRHYETRHDGYIDLTTESSPPPPFEDQSISDSDFIAFLQPESATPPTTTNSNIMPPRRQHSFPQQHARKRRRLDSEGASQSRPSSSHQHSQIQSDSGNFIALDSPSSEEPNEVLDLTEIEDRDALNKVQQEQRERHLALQEQQNQFLKESVQAQEPENKGPFKLGQLQCVICMDNMTDMTATHCGHLFCHTCIMEALIAGENQSGDGKGMPRCPSCRTKVVRAPNKGAPQIIPLALKFTKKSEKARGKERVSI